MEIAASFLEVTEDAGNATGPLTYSPCVRVCVCEFTQRLHLISSALVRTRPIGLQERRGARDESSRGNKASKPSGDGAESNITRGVTEGNLCRG